jgi:hypothetical protein
MRLAACFLAGVLVGCSAAIVPVRPPTAPSEVRGPRPYAEAFWKTGHFAWDNGKQLHYWVPGGWDPAREGYIWFPGQWEPVDDDGKRLGWRWVEERWVQLVDLERTKH